MAIKTFYVIGGEYADTTFKTIAEGKAEERYGPFPEKEAHDLWRSLTGKTVDNALIRYRVKPEAVGSEDCWYVVGGEYASTEFSTIATGHKLESYGPYPRPEALAVWRAITSKSVDNAMARYDIVTVEELTSLKASS
ncbi:MAG TPA: DUF4170 domain-containing protein [Patescibacteria group bacterium]|nr:DUF4170 domain-containing protein [Patescibacteria group bacterium]